MFTAVKHHVKLFNINWYLVYGIVSFVSWYRQDKEVVGATAIGTTAEEDLTREERWNIIWAAAWQKLIGEPGPRGKSDLYIK